MNRDVWNIQLMHSKEEQSILITGILFFHQILLTSLGFLHLLLIFPIICKRMMIIHIVDFTVKAQEVGMPQTSSKSVE